MTTVNVPAKPEPLPLNLDSTALVLIDMQRDFLEAGGFGESLGNDVSQLRKTIGPCARLLSLARARGMLVIHTREGHLPDLSDAHPAKVNRGSPSLRIGSEGPMGRILIRGEPGHAIISDLAPTAGEVVIDKPGKGAFYNTEMESVLREKGIETLLICGVTTEVCVHTTLREANDRGYRCLLIEDACGSYFPEFHEAAVRMVYAQGGIFGWVTDSETLLSAVS